MPGCPDWIELSLGFLIGVVDVVDCVRVEEVAGQPYAYGPWCWVLENPRRIEPVAWRGSLSLFEVPVDAIKPVR